MVLRKIYQNGLKNFGERMYIKETIKMRRWMFVLMVLMVSLVSAQTLKERFEHAYQEALQIAQKIKGEWDRFEALRSIAIAMAIAGQFDRALQIAQKIEGGSKRSSALRVIAKAMAELIMPLKWRKRLMTLLRAFKPLLPS
jgi:chromosome condensin MukBEF ATPase and DNA-binding subunit MukB